ncbi:protein of unknown function [Candidatus Hydrogenisulfobacillus filiaventi]|uniref:Uncharacterized protein n=1 Tax=Candidatus Hydrogenisulfobacillus filiaventi TaxID=2707344 RepID=A0A6F8ZCZ3_9FIRM|nr:protein of unknown function [Candidatus Hydrogenisulfobacillus filiaventi]
MRARNSMPWQDAAIRVCSHNGGTPGGGLPASGAKERRDPDAV